MEIFRFLLKLQRIMSTVEKTPIAILNELCMQEGKTLVWEDIPQPTAPHPPFVCKVEAFDIEVFGTAQSKKQAKHEACAKLIGGLRQSTNKLALIFLFSIYFWFMVTFDFRSTHETTIFC